MRLRVAQISAFTLVEVAIAVAILGAAMTTLVGMQTRFVNNFIREEERMTAALYAQYLMTMMETEGNVSVGVERDSLDSILDRAGYFDGLPRTLRGEVNGWEYERNTEDLDLGPLEAALRQSTLFIRWGSNQENVFQVVYFTKGGDE